MKMNKISLALIASSLICLTGNVAASDKIASAQVNLVQLNAAVAQSVMVKVAISSDLEASDLKEKLANRFGDKVVFDRVLGTGDKVFYIPTSLATEHAIDEVKAITGVDTASNLPVIKISLPEQEYENIQAQEHTVQAKTDTYYASQVMLQVPYDAATNPAGYLGASDLERAMDESKDNFPVHLAVIDSGYIEHEDLDMRYGAIIAQGYPSSFVVDPLPNVDPAVGQTTTGRRGLSYFDLTAYHDVAGDNVGRECSSGHGTAVAGLLGAKTDNSKGIAGIAPNAHITMVTPFYSDCDAWAANGFTTSTSTSTAGSDDVIDGLTWATGANISDLPDIDHPLVKGGVDVVNMSIGGRNVNGGCMEGMQTAVDYSIDSGAIVIVSAGNENEDVSLGLLSSCANIIVVGANDENGNKSTYSNYGGNVTITAMGDHHSVLSPIVEGLDPVQFIPYQYSVGDVGTATGSNGTSFSITAVSGLASLMRGTWGDIIDQDLFRHLITTTAVAHPTTTAPLNPPVSLSEDCSNNRCGAGILNAYAVIQKAQSVLDIAGATVSPFTGLNSCQDTSYLEAIQHYTPVCDIYSLSIENSADSVSNHYEVVKAPTSNDEGDWSGEQIVYTTTTDLLDRSYTLKNVDLEDSKYGVRACDSGRCYVTRQVLFDEESLPAFCSQ
jgi:hypothetical protein